MLKIYGNMRSAPCRKVRYTAEITETPYEWKEMDFRSGELKSESYRLLHPAGKVPAIDDHGFALFESEAICKYLCEKSGHPLYPAELQLKAQVDQWRGFAWQHLGTAMNKVAFNRILAPEFGIPVDERSLKEGLEWLERYLPIVDAQLSTLAFLVCDHMTLADVVLLSVLDLAGPSDVDLTGFQEIQRWLGVMHELPAWQKFRDPTD